MGVVSSPTDLRLRPFLGEDFAVLTGVTGEELLLLGEAFACTLKDFRVTLVSWGSLALSESCSSAASSMGSTVALFGEILILVERELIFLVRLLLACREGDSDDDDDDSESCALSSTFKLIEHDNLSSLSGIKFTSSSSSCNVLIPTLSMGVCGGGGSVVCVCAECSVAVSPPFCSINSTTIASVSCILIFCLSSVGGRNICGAVVVSVSICVISVVLISFCSCFLVLGVATGVVV